MKVTVTFGDTVVVVPCKAGWTVRDLVSQATRRYRRILEQHGESAVKTHHLEYGEGGILDMDDLLADLVEDRDRLVAVFEDVPSGRTDSPRDGMYNGYSSPSPEPFQYHSTLQYQDPVRGEIEVNEAILKSNTPLLVRSSSDSALTPAFDVRTTPQASEQSTKPAEMEISDVLRGAVDRLRKEEQTAKMKQFNFSTLTRTVTLPGDEEPLGIHVVPYCSSLSGRPLGLYIKGIEANSRSKRDNLFQEDECIVQINDTPLHDKTFAQSQEIFRQAMAHSKVCLEVLPVAIKPRYEKSLISHLFTADGNNSRTKSPLLLHTKAGSQPELRQDSINQIEARQPDMHAKTAQTTPGDLHSDKSSPTPPALTGSPSSTPRTYSRSPLAGKNPVLPGLSSLSNKKGGKRIKIDLKKGAEGLGFTVVTRDMTVHNPGPILVKNILPRGAAVKDGRLQPGDRILEVNGVDMTGRSQEELVAMLRSTRQGEMVSVVVARQDDIFLPRELKDENAGGVVLEDGREQLMYEIPLNETGSAGLGVSLKGNKSRETWRGHGLSSSSPIIHGGAAYKDGRLSVNDQLIAVNGESLLGRSNHAAMEMLRRSMSSEGNARGTIQLVVLRAARQMNTVNPATSFAPNGTATHQLNPQTSSRNQEPWGYNGPAAYQGPAPSSRPSSAELVMNVALPAAHASGSSSHYGNHDQESVENLPRSFSPSAVEDMNRDLPPTLQKHRDFQKPPYMAAPLYAKEPQTNFGDNTPRSRASKSMDMLADESNIGSLVGERNEPSGGGTLGPTLGLMKSSSLESLQTAMSEAKQNHIQTHVPFHRPRPHMVRGRGCNQSFRIAIDKSYDGRSEDDDDLSEQSSGQDTPASSSSRQDLDADDGKKKPVGKKKEKKGKGKKKADDSLEDLEKKTKKKGFGILRFGKKKEDKSKEAAKGTKNKLEALSEEELDGFPDSRDGSDPRYTEITFERLTPDPASRLEMEDDEDDPSYARIDNFRQPPSPQPPPPLARTPSPLLAAEELDGLYAKVNKPRPTPVTQNQNQMQADSDQRVQMLRREYQQVRAIPGYEELDTAHRRVLEYNPQRLAPRGADARPPWHYEEVDRQYQTQSRRDRYDYPTNNRLALYPGYQHDSSAPSHAGRLPLPQQGTQSQQVPNSPPHYSSSPHQGQQHRAALRQDVPPSPVAGRRGLTDGYRQAGPSRYMSPERYPVSRERYNSPDRYGDGRQPDPRHKNPMIGAV
ncbi:partitioning defective 3 homolog B-like isoform X2 [Thalassophryne amazonica]|uniref:partitioning defective 3 homolog B-like isoform X2 n=1 Tax=Thalassophryne amazonica TaxID=390379 RepID=UPI001471F0A6|nr:partitioning defective 3 homolog B-like isoform X2 [Thalassophryne amazonica]